MTCECETFTLYSSGITDYLFPYPEWAKPNNEISKDVILFNLWNAEDIETSDKGISTQTFTIGGKWCLCESLITDDLYVWETDIDTLLYNLTLDINAGEEFTINELTTCFNGVYIIKNFKFKTLRGTPYCYEWELILERVRDLV